METSDALSRPTSGEVAELQGLYGTYHVTETLLQKVWLRREFDVSRARLTNGERLEILHPGSWNRLAGPDFRGARLKLGDRVITGDVEVHFHAAAWTQHGHDRDPAYEDVVLHVVLFPPATDEPAARTRNGREIPALVLVDLLWHDLEEYASDEAVAALSGRDPLPVIEELLALAPTPRLKAIVEAAERRWHEKVHFARRRIERVGWEQACHLTTLEILGYRANRVAMLRVGERFPWRTWVEEVPPIDALIAAAGDAWSSRGVRPANQPRWRLAQYRAWMQRVPDWPDQLRAWTIDVPEAANVWRDVARFRRTIGLPRVRTAIARQFTGAELGGTRLDTWICNLLLPFGAARRQEKESPGIERLWTCWPSGDAPASLLAAAAQLSTPDRPLVRANGLVQGLLGLQLARQAGAAIRPSSAAGQ